MRVNLKTRQFHFFAGLRLFATKEVLAPLIARALWAFSEKKDRPLLRSYLDGSLLEQGEQRNTFDGCLGTRKEGNCCSLDQMDVWSETRTLWLIVESNLRWVSAYDREVRVCLDTIKGALYCSLN